MPASSPPAHASHRPRRSSAMRFFVIALLCLLTPIFVFGATVAVTVAATGVATVRVQERGPDGVDLWIPVPAVLFDVAIAAAPRLMPEHELAEAREQVEPYLPMLRELADAIESLPSATLVEVDSGRDHVRIAKVGRNFEITVHSDDADVRVSVPARLVGRGLDLFG